MYAFQLCSIAYFSIVLKFEYMKQIEQRLQIGVNQKNSLTRGIPNSKTLHTPFLSYRPQGCLPQCIFVRLYVILSMPFSKQSLFLMKRKLPSSRSLPYYAHTLGSLNKQSSFNIRKPRARQIASSKTVNIQKKLSKTNYHTPELYQQISSSSWIVFDLQSNKTFGHRVNTEKEVASLTKIMTCIVVLELMEKYKLDKNVKVKVNKNSSNLSGTSANLVEDSWVDVYDLLYGLMLPSGNDAAWLLAQVFGLLIFYQKYKSKQTLYEDIQSIDVSTYEATDHFINQFIKAMNKKARSLNMLNSNFSNPHGLVNASNYSSAKDISILCKHCLRNSKFVQIVNTKSYVAPVLFNDQQFQIEWKNTNKLLEQGWMGIKTGQTISAGACLASCKNGIIIVVLNSTNSQKRFEDTVLLYESYITWKGAEVEGY